MTELLVDDVRRLAGASTTDATDADIARELERSRQYVKATLCWHPDTIGPGTVHYSLAHIPAWGQLSPGTATQDNGGTIPVGTIRDAYGTSLTGWSVDRDGWVTFTPPGTLGSAYYFTGWGYDVNRAAANVLESMAATEQRQHDVALADGTDVKRSQKYTMLRQQAKELRKKQLPRDVRVIRSDEA